jgi:hypothetical protein
MFGAGEGNRTLVISLEGCCSTIELHPRRPAAVTRPPPSLYHRAGDLLSFRGARQARSEHHCQNRLTLAGSPWALVAVAMAASMRASLRPVSRPVAKARLALDRRRRIPMAAMRSSYAAMSLSSPSPFLQALEGAKQPLAPFACLLSAEQAREKLNRIAQLLDLDAQLRKGRGNQRPARSAFIRAFGGGGRTRTYEG